MWQSQGFIILDILLEVIIIVVNHNNIKTREHGKDKQILHPPCLLMFGRR